MTGLTDVFGYSRQAFYRRQALEKQRQRQAEATLRQVQAIRRSQPRVGCRKLHRMIEPQGLGRDRFFDLLREHELLVKRRRSYRRTTWAGRRFFPNLVRDLAITRVGQVVVSDITYLETAEGFCYLFLTTDYYSRKIVGYSLRQDLTAQGSVEAMRMAVRDIGPAPIHIHHSDRGWQYSAEAFQQLLRSHQIQISMTEEDHVYENAVAERVNGILKTELGLSERLPSHRMAEVAVRQAIDIYNNERLHLSLGYKTPSQKFIEKSVNYFRT